MGGGAKEQPDVQLFVDAFALRIAASFRVCEFENSKSGNTTTGEKPPPSVRKLVV